MTESEWLAATDPDQMLRFVGIYPPHRKHRLFDVACCRRVWQLLTPPGRKLVAVLERYLDQRANIEEVQEALEEQEEFDGELDVSYHSAADLAALSKEPQGYVSSARDEACDQESAEQCHLLRDILGNPFRQSRVDPSWLIASNQNVARLAESIYEQGAFNHLPILADALEDPAAPTSRFWSIAAVPARTYAAAGSSI
jgi:hypothetical protein